MSLNPKESIAAFREAIQHLKCANFLFVAAGNRVAADHLKLLIADAQYDLDTAIARNFPVTAPRSTSAGDQS